MIELRPTRFAATELAVGQFEFSHSLKLPADYREFLLAGNGGVVEGDHVFEKYAEVDACCISMFYRLVDSRRSTSTLRYQYDLVAWRLPRHVIAIGCDSGNAKICLDVRAGKSAKVYFWNIDKDPEDTAAGSFENILEIAPTFTEFLAGIRPAPDFES